MNDKYALHIVNVKMVRSSEPGCKLNMPELVSLVINAAYAIVLVFVDCKLKIQWNLRIKEMLGTI